MTALARTPRATVVVVDDQESNRFVKCQVLERAGLRVLAAATGGEGLAMIARESPDLVLLDVNLPDISGIEVTRRLRAGEKGLPALQIVQISSTAVGTADQVQGLEQGADVYLTEPTSPLVLVATVNALLRVRRAEVALAEALNREREARGTAEEATRLRDEFLATLSHELRTPLNALMGWIWQLRHATLDPEKRERAFDSLERNARIQAQLINDLLDISRITKGKLQLEMRLVDICAVAEAAIESIKESAERKHIALVVDCETAWAAGDEARLQQIVSNLLTNAVQFTPEGGQIRLSVRNEGTSAVLRVQDTGAGIDPAFLPHVFDQFRQAEGGLSRKHGGLGLGLTVVRQLIELHNGSVTVESEGTGRGSTFTVKMPAEEVNRADNDLGSRPLLSGLQVLVAEDIPGERQAIAAILESSGAEVTACQKREADTTLLNSRFDALVGFAPLSGPAGLTRIQLTMPIQAAELVRSVFRGVRQRAASG
jgi:signal transduction histidine kinase